MRSFTAPAAKNGKLSPAYRAAVTGIMAALAIAMSYLESLVPATSFAPPGVKAGFSNIVTMFAAVAFGPVSALCVAVIKSLFVFLTRGTTSFVMSVSGGVLSALVMSLLIRTTKKTPGWVGISVLSACAHNMAQLAAASLLAGGDLFRSYASFLLLFGAAAGVLTGVLLAAVMPALARVRVI